MKIRERVVVREDADAYENPLDRLLVWTEFPDWFARSKKRRRSSLRQLGYEIQRTVGKTKDELSWLKLAEFGDEPKSERTGCLRHYGNMIAVHGIELDFDKGDPTWDQALARLWEARIPGLLYTTRRHTSEMHRFRILLPLSRPMPPAERARLVARAYGVVRGTIDGACFALPQSFYFGSPGGVRVFIELIDPLGGRYIDQAGDLDAGALNKKGEPWDSEPVMEEPDKDDFGALKREPDVARIRAALKSIPASRWDDDYNEWLSIGQALHHEFDGDPEGLALWDETSQRCLMYDSEEMASKWETFGNYAGQPRTIASIYKQANGDNDDPHIARLNQRHAIVAVRGRTLVATESDDGGTDFGPVQDLHNLYANDRVAVTDKRTEEISRRWMRHPGRRTYANGIAFAPGGAPTGVLNLFRGWAVKPDPDAFCGLFLNHIREVVCDGNAHHAQYILGWMAHMVQRPDEKPGVALVVRGSKGAGKDTVGEYLSRMIGYRHVPTIAHSEHIVGKFNQRMECALILHVQEGSWAGDRKAEEQLKYLVTSSFVEIERKGIDSINVRSVLRLFISANAEWVVPASRDERRWAVFEVSDAQRGNAAYFSALRAEMNGDGPAALLHYLQHFELSGFDVRKAPETVGLRNQKLASLRGINRWWFDRLLSGEVGSNFAITPWGNGWHSIDCDELRGDYMTFMRGFRFDGDPLDAATFGKRFREMVPKMEKRRRGGRGDRSYTYRLPPLILARQCFAEWLGSPVDWESLQ